MIYVGIDIAKDKHDCIIINSDDEVLVPAFVISNNRKGFDELYHKIISSTTDFSKVKVGLEATGHYNYNILGFLLDKSLTTFVINPLQVNLFRKSRTIRKTKTDKVDAHIIALLIKSDVNLKPYSKTSYHNEELKSLTRYRFNKVNERAKLKVSISRLVTILFPEVEKLVSTIHLASVYKLLSAYPSASQIASAHLTTLTNLLSEASRGKYKKNAAIMFREAARLSIGTDMEAKSLELRHTLKAIEELNREIKEIEAAIKAIIDDINSPILGIPGISYRMGAMIIAEIGDFERFDSPDKILAYAGLSPTTYQSGKFVATHSRMEKRGSKYLRYALFNATKFVCQWDPTFAMYLAKKRAEGKHYNVAIPHASKKLVRVIYALEKSGQQYRKVA